MQWCRDNAMMPWQRNDAVKTQWCRENAMMPWKRNDAVKTQWCREKKTILISPLIEIDLPEIRRADTEPTSASRKDPNGLNIFLHSF